MQFGAVLPDHVGNNLSQSEIAFFNGYNGTLAKYQRAMEIDLESHMTPPQSLHVKVRVSRDCEIVETKEGHKIKLLEGHCIVLPIYLAEPLIRQGVFGAYRLSFLYYHES